MSYNGLLKIYKRKRFSSVKLRLVWYATIYHIWLQRNGEFNPFKLSDNILSQNSVHVATKLSIIVGNKIHNIKINKLCHR